MTKRISHPPPRRTQAQSLRAFLAGPPKVGQRALAEAVGCHQSMISMLARGKRLPSATLAVQLHAVTGVPLKMLLAPKLRKTRRKGSPTIRGDPGPQALAAT